MVTERDVFCIFLMMVMMLYEDESRGGHLHWNAVNCTFDFYAFDVFYNFLLQKCSSNCFNLDIRY